MKKVLTPDEVATVLGLSRRTVVGWLEAGKMPGIKVGNRWRVKEENLEKFLDEPNMYFNDYIHRARFVDLQRLSGARARELVACIYIFACLPKPLDEFILEGAVDIAGVNRATRFWGPVERSLVRAALAMYDAREDASINEVFSNLDDRSRQVVMQALRLRW